MPGLTSQQLELLSSPDFFGHMVHIYGPEAALVVYEGECSITPYEVVEATSSHVDIRFYDEFNEEEAVKRIHLEQGRLWLRAGRAREIFTRVLIADVADDHQCVRELLRSPSWTGAREPGPAAPEHATPR